MSFLNKNKVLYLLVPFLYLLITLVGLVGTVSAADTLSWTAANGAQVAAESTTWSNRLVFIAPNRIKDSVTNTIYETTKDIWGNGNSAYLADGHDYRFVPLDAEGNQVEWSGAPGGTCMGVIIWHLNEDGSTSDLKVAQPSKSGDQSDCVLDGKSVTDQSRKGGPSGEEEYYIARLGEASETPDDWKGSLPYVRNAVAPFYWASDSKIGIFDSDRSFSLATGGPRDTLLDGWKKAEDSGVSQADRDNSSLWEVWKHSKCENEFLVVAKRTSSASGIGYLINKDGGMENFSGENCLTGRDMDDGDSRDLINLGEKSIGIAYTENGVKSAADVGEDPTGTGNDSSTTDNPQSCEALGGAFSFILCPLLKTMDASFGWLDDRIVAALNVNANYYNTPGVKGAWANMRNIAYILLIPVLLIMVIGTALGFSFVDAYTVKRALPRLIIAIVFIALSFEIAKLLVELSNIVGQGTAGLIAAPFGGMDNLKLSTLFEPSAGTDVLFAGGAIVGGVIAYLSGVTIWGIAITIGLAVLAMMLVFILLTVREMIIIFLMILAPLAILSWIFPGNDKPWKIWWGAFSKMLIFFPLIMALIVSGRAFASIVRDSGSDEAVVISTMIKLVAFVGPYFFIPMAFKFAGGALGNLAGMVNNKSKGLFDRGKKARSASFKSKRGRVQSGQGLRPNSMLGRTRLGSALRIGGAGVYSQIDAVKNDGLGRGLLSKQAGDTRRAAASRLRDEERKHAEQDATLMREVQNDQFAEVLSRIVDKPETSDDDLMGYLKGHGYTDTGGVALITQARSMYEKYGHSIAATAVMGKVGSNTSYTGGVDQMLDDIMRAGHGDEGYMMSMLGQARSTAAAKGLFHLSGGSYGEDAAMLQAMVRFNANGKQALTGEDAQFSYMNETTGQRETFSAAGMDEEQLRAAINNRKEEKARDSMQSWDFARIHPTAAKKLAGGLNQEVSRLSADAQSEQNPAERQRKMRALGQKVAQVRSINAAVSQSAPEEVKRIFADALDNSSGEQAAITVGGDSYGSLNQLMSSVDQMSRTPPGDRTAASADYEAVTSGFKSTTYSPYDGMNAAERAAREQQQGG